MKKIQEKVKDIVEVCKFSSLQDFTADPVLTLASYHFTDATADLMGKWLDRIADLQDGRGSASALAGYRGVGKSHFMATMGAIVALPELRTKITDAHVAASAQRLLRRRYPVAYVRRGTRDTILEELQDALSSGFEIDITTVPETVTGLLTAARAKSGDIPFVLMIDTAFERGSRVARDDGPMLAEIADTAKELNAFVGVALDDDIAGADGTNSVIIRAFTIDYLDQEHLYKVVDTLVFPKNNQLRGTLHEIYEYFREVLPSFRWSEQRFSSLYPLHPAILEVAPFVRLYVHDFALLGFASEAGERILGRPANSLIALDEVFDNAEQGLRKIEDLDEAFVAYDRLNAEVVAKIPVMQRLQAKLILKALLLLSLDGQGTTAAEISAGMLIFDENEPQKSVKTVEELIRLFATALPEEVQSHSEDGHEIRYGLKVSSKDELNKAVTAAKDEVSPEAIHEVLHKLVHERFGDSTFFSIDGTSRDLMECQLTWRGGLRRGRVYWKDQGSSAEKPHIPAESDLHDWEVVIDFSPEDPPKEQQSTDISVVYWKPAELRRDETDALKRYIALGTRADLREQFGDQIRASLHSHTVLAERIVNRIFLEDGKLVIDAFDYNFTEEARVAPLMSDLFSIMLEPLFEMRYPQHPYFLRKLGMFEVATLVTDLYSGSRQRLNEVQQLAQTYALPLGLVKLHDGVYLPQTEETLSALPAVERIISLVDADGKSDTTLKSIYSDLKKVPNGLVREAQQLILTAMVAQRMIEFVTSKGDRINQRSLDLQIIWDDIVGIARPLDNKYSTKKLLKWASVLAGEGQFKSFDDPSDRTRLKQAFGGWLADWNASGVLAGFSSLPPESVNTKIWRVANRTNKSLGSLAANIGSCLDEAISIEECLTRIADAFLDDPAELEKARVDLAEVDGFVKGFVPRRQIRTYLALAEITDSTEIEQSRDALSRTMDDCDLEPTDDRIRDLGYLWAKFQREFSEHFITHHNAVMKSHFLQARFDEIVRSDEWWEFENLAAIDHNSTERIARVRSIRERFGQLNCKADIAENLKLRPFCECGFSLAKIAEWEALPDIFVDEISRALKSMRSGLFESKASIIPAIEKIAAKNSSISAAASELVRLIDKSDDSTKLTVAQFQILRTIHADEKLKAGSGESRKVSESGFDSREKDVQANSLDEVLLNI